LEIDKTPGQHTIKGGRTILGKIFAYQERTSASLNEINNMPYIQFVIGMLDAPSIDWEKKKEKKIETAEDEVNAIMNALK